MIEVLNKATREVRLLTLGEAIDAKYLTFKKLHRLGDGFVFQNTAEAWRLAGLTAYVGTWEPAIVREFDMTKDREAIGAICWEIAGKRLNNRVLSETLMDELNRKGFAIVRKVRR